VVLPRDANELQVRCLCAGKDETMLSFRKNEDQPIRAQVNRRVIDHEQSTAGGTERKFKNIVAVTLCGFVQI
jgi:ribose 1,5-bisphosphokinase PhnN